MLRNVGILRGDQGRKLPQIRIFQGSMVDVPEEQTGLDMKSTAMSLIYLTPCSWALFEKAPVAWPFKNFPTFHGTRRFIILPSSREPDTLSQLNLAYTTPSHFSNIHFNTIPPLTSRSPYWSLSFWLSHQNPICISLPPPLYVLHVLPTHTPWLSHFNYTSRKVQLMKLLILQCHYITEIIAG
jgi:hypothetical protein